jgi:hypothetical protein
VTFGLRGSLALRQNTRRQCYRPVAGGVSVSAFGREGRIHTYALLTELELLTVRRFFPHARHCELCSRGRLDEVTANRMRGRMRQRGLVSKLRPQLDDVPPEIPREETRRGKM